MIQVKKSNIRYIDYFKALLIITVVLAHINYANDGIKPWVMFNMPAFFFASGTLLKGLKGREPGVMKKTLEKKLLRLMLPYFLWALIYSSLSISNLLRIAYGSHSMLGRGGLYPLCGFCLHCFWLICYFIYWLSHLARG